MNRYKALDVLMGERKVGKTTMLQKLMEGTDRRYVTLARILTVM